MPERQIRYRTGRPDLDERITELVAAAGIERDADLVFETIVSCVRMGRESVDRADLKLVNSALKELRYSFLVFEAYEEAPKVAIFGSARTPPEDPSYLMAREFAATMAGEGWMVITGGGPGIMEAGIEGAGRDQSFGVTIQLPFEEQTATFLAGDIKQINFRYFFTRKLTFVKESAAFALFPGGFGTLDEALELLTLVQTGRHPMCPIVLLDPPGSTFWEEFRAFVGEHLAARGLISPGDIDLARRHTDVAAAVAEICDFYSTYHSARYVGRRLVLRLRREITDAELEALNREFADILLGGAIERAEVSTSERNDDDHVDLPRIALRFDRRRTDRLRTLIDRLNHPVG